MGDVEATCKAVLWMVLAGVGAGVPMWAVCVVSELPVLPAASV